MEGLPAGLLARFALLDVESLFGLLTAEFTENSLLHYRQQEKEWCLHTETTERFTFRGETVRECVTKALIAYYLIRQEARSN